MPRKPIIELPFLRVVKIYADLSAHRLDHRGFEWMSQGQRSTIPKIARGDNVAHPTFLSHDSMNVLHT